MSPHHRRQFLVTSARWSGALLSASALHPRWLLGQEATKAASAESAAKLIPGKDPRLVVLEPFPAVIETPRGVLLEHVQTPIDQLFVRNNQQPEDVATLEPVPLQGWQIELAGLLSKPQAFDAEILTKLPTVSVEMVLQCSGNGRALYSQAAQTKGTQWGQGGMGCVQFEGVRLSELLKHLEIDVDKQARFFTAEGRDEAVAGKQDFEHSLPVDEALNRSILALRLNGKDLPAIHGGPVRLVTPGVYGTMHLKWLSHLTFLGEESQNENHAKRYRVPKRRIKPGDEFTADLNNSRFNWRMNVKSVVLSPAPGGELKSGSTTIRGVAFNDGAAPIDVVLISLDGGSSWRKAKLEKAAGPYAWWPWSLNVELSAGKQTILARAVDALGRSQPSEGSIRWNPSGYEWNGVEPVTVMVS